MWDLILEPMRKPKLEPLSICRIQSGLFLPLISMGPRFRGPIMPPLGILYLMLRRRRFTRDGIIGLRPITLIFSIGILGFLIQISRNAKLLIFRSQESSTLIFWLWMELTKVVILLLMALLM
jgi:hypothetical protein